MRKGGRSKISWKTVAKKLEKVRKWSNREWAKRLVMIMNIDVLWSHSFHIVSFKFPIFFCLQENNVFCDWTVAFLGIDSDMIWGQYYKLLSQNLMKLACPHMVILTQKDKNRIYITIYWEVLNYSEIHATHRILI